MFAACTHRQTNTDRLIYRQIQWKRGGEGEGGGGREREREREREMQIDRQTEIRWRVVDR